MGCDWIMHILYKITFKDGTTTVLCNPTISKGIYLSYDDSPDIQMNQWKELCPTTIIYEHEQWNKYDTMPDVVYITPEWCGISVHCKRIDITSMITSMQDVITIETIAYPEIR